MDELEEFDKNTDFLRIQKVRTWYFILMILFLFFLLFLFFYPITTFQTYEGIVAKEEEYVMKFYLKESELLKFKESDLYLNRSKRNYQIKKIKSTSELGSVSGLFELTLEFELQKEEQIENRIFLITSSSKTETLFQKIQKSWKEKFDLWLS